MPSTSSMFLMIVPVILAGCANTGTTVVKSPVPGDDVAVMRGAKSGERQEVGFTMYVNPDCATEGEAKLAVTAPPKHGNVAFRAGERNSSFPKENVRNACNTRKLPATLIDYTATPGYVGTDEFVIADIGPQGEYSIHRYVIQVH